ncbi:MAG: ABC transporter substrate-binding protein [Acidimicrobiales bacterium]|nr:ABC transporter substrate-binding protein [Acidimicrobiales bacterium]
MSSAEVYRDHSSTWLDMPRHRLRRRFAFGVVATCVAVALVGSSCSKKQTAPSSAGTPDTEARTESNNKYIAGPKDAANPERGGKIVFAIEADPEGLDPTRYAFAVSGHFIASAFYDPLATLDKDGQVMPYLAESITESNGNRTWTITLREGVTFHNGKPVDAEAVKANFEAHRKSYVTQLAMKPVLTIEKTGDRTLVVTLDRPWSGFGTVLLSQLGYVMEPSMLDDPSLATRPIGSGPFLYDSRRPGQSWVLVKNPNYWRKDDKGNPLPYLDSIEFRIVTSSAQRLSMLERGDVDMIHTNHPDEVLALKASNFKRVDYADGEKDFLILNTEKPPFNNLKARQALAYATNAEGWRTQVMKGVEQPSNGPFNPGQLGYLEDNGFPTFDLANAKQLVKEYEAETGQPFEFQFIMVEDAVGWAQYLKDFYDQAGMKVAIQTLPQLQLVAQTATGNYQLGLFRNFGFHNPDTDAVFWRASSVLPPPNVSLNFPRISDPRIDQIIDRAIAATSDAERHAAYQELSKLFAEQLPYVWLGRPNWILAASPSVNGFYEAANGSIQNLGGKTWIAGLWVKR